MIVNPSSFFFFFKHSQSMSLGKFISQSARICVVSHGKCQLSNTSRLICLCAKSLRHRASPPPFLFPHTHTDTHMRSTTCCNSSSTNNNYCPNKLGAVAERKACLFSMRPVSPQGATSKWQSDESHLAQL